MQFHIDADNGTSIAGWLVPDNPASIPRLAIASPGLKEIELEANVLRPDLKELGLHGTGMAGFQIDERIVPGLEKLDDIEVRDAGTRILIYRRFREAHHLQRKLFLYGLYAMPQTQIDNRISRHFALNYQAVERHSFDTLFSIINNHFSSSIFLSGRPRYFRYRDLLRERGFTIVTLLRDPFEELAERLLFIRYASTDESPAFMANYMTGLEGLVDVVKQMDFGDSHSIASAFKSLNAAQREALSSPFIRTIAASLDEPPEKKHISIGLDHLAGMDLVGVTGRFEDFKLMLSELVGVDMLGSCQLTTVSWVPVIAEQLSQLDEVNRLLALDVELFSQANAAITKALNAA